MKEMYSGEQAKAIDTHAIGTMGMPSLVLMEKAAMSVVSVLLEKAGPSDTFLCVCGIGNNGGDGVCVARILHEMGYQAAVTVVGNSEHMSEEMKTQLVIASACDVPILTYSLVSMDEYDILIDAVFGIGLSREVTGVYEQVILDMNQSGVTVYSLDIPSGIHAKSAKVLGCAVQAEATITFGVNKTGLVLYPGCEYAGKVYVADIGFPRKSVAFAQVRLLSKEFVDRNMDTQIMINESSDYRCMFRTHETDWQRGYQIQAFFCPDSVDTYLGDTPNVPRLMLGHSYWTTTPLSELRNIRCQLRDTLDKHQVGFWQTETCIMGNDEEIGGGNGFDHTMKTALYVARIIHHDIVYARAESWQWWRAIGGDYKDGLIREYTTDDNFLDGRVEDSKLMWALGNYSRFIRPGAVRLSVSAFDQTGALIPDGDTDQQGLMCSAYKNVDGTYVMVVINYANEEKEFSIHKGKVGNTQWQIYRTSDKEGENLLPVRTVKSGKTVQIPARSIVTLQGK